MGMWVAGRVGPRGPSISRLANPSFYRITGTTKWRTLRSGQDCKFAFSSLNDVREAVSTPSAPGRMVLRPGILLVREVHGTKRWTVTHCLFQGHLGAPGGRGKKQHDHYCGHLLTSAPCMCVPDTRLHMLGSEPHDHTGRLQRPHLRGEGIEAQRGGVACPRAKGRGDLTQTHMCIKPRLPSSAFRGRGEGHRGANDHATQKLLLVSSVIQAAKVQITETDTAKVFKGDKGLKRSVAKPLL